ncbi:MAG: TIM barrel protein [Verrucomicrobiales bacterium]|nr:TIM barrel protein [Verrucomicrobiales bacterium]
MEEVSLSRQGESVRISAIVRQGALDHDGETMISRRTFLTTTAAATGIPLAGLAEKTETCGLAIGTYGLQSMSVEDALRLIARTGYDAAEITVFAGTTGDRAGALISKESRERVRGVLGETGLRLCALMADLKPEKDDAAHYTSLSTLNGLIEMARDLWPDKPPLIQTILGGKKWEESKGLFRDRLADWNRILADQKGYLSIKPHRSHAMSDPTQAAWLLQQLGNPRRLSMVYDYSHYAFQDPARSIGETVEAALSITKYVAVKDAVEVDGKVRFALAGASDSWDQADVVKRLYQGGYRGDFCCEVSSQIWRGDPNYDPVKATELCFQNMKAAFERAGVERG